VQYVRYAAPGWGVGELVFDGEILLHAELPRPIADGRLSPPWDCPQRLAQRLEAYFAGAKDGFADILLDLDGATEFQRALTTTLRNVAYGEVVTYAELAARAGYPRAQRAAGTFCAHNRFAVVVPCHRVVAADGLGSYGTLGVAYKRRLLELEGVVL
jgi:methylated-DNA-[protein]-cysteine S-methyltransferase